MGYIDLKSLYMHYGKYFCNVFFKFLSRYIMYVFIDGILWTDYISLYKIDLPYLCIIKTNYRHMYLIASTQSVLCLLLSNDSFFVHSCLFLKY